MRFHFFASVLLLLSVSIVAAEEAPEVGECVSGECVATGNDSEEPVVGLEEEAAKDEPVAIADPDKSSDIEDEEEKEVKDDVVAEEMAVTDETISEEVVSGDENAAVDAKEEDAAESKEEVKAEADLEDSKEERAEADEEPAAVDEEPAAVDEEPAAVDEEPAAVDEEPAAVDEEPAAVDEEPAASEEEPAAAEEEPAAVDEKPAVVDEKPAAVDEKPAAVDEKPAVVDEKPAEPKKTEEARVTTEKTTGPATCPDRDHLMRCTAAHLDTNKNGKLERSELQAAVSSLPWYARGILKILGSVDKMMKKCDIDKDDAISIDYDMQHNQEVCLNSCFKRRAFKGAFFPECEL